MQSLFNNWIEVQRLLVLVHDQGSRTQFDTVDEDGKLYSDTRASRSKLLATVPATNITKGQ